MIFAFLQISFFNGVFQRTPRTPIAIANFYVSSKSQRFHFRNHDNNPIVSLCKLVFRLVLSSERSMIAHRLSYFLKLKGPSMALDTGCSSSGYALENAYTAIRLGQIDNAIVGGTHLCLNPGTTMQFFRQVSNRPTVDLRSVDIIYRKLIRYHEDCSTEIRLEAVKLFFSTNLKK